MRLVKLKCFENERIGVIRADRIEGVVAVADCGKDSWTVSIKLIGGSWLDEPYPDGEAARKRYRELVKIILLEDAK